MCPAGALTYPLVGAEGPVLDKNTERINSPGRVWKIRYCGEAAPLFLCLWAVGTDYGT